MGGGYEYALPILAWREWKASAAFFGTSDAHALAEPPVWFVRCELGCGVCGCGRCVGDRGASLLKTFERWRRINRAALRFLNEPTVCVRAERAADTVADVVARVRARLGVRP